MTSNKAPRSGSVRPNNLVAQIAEDLRTKLLSGDFKAGDRVNIRSLAAEYSVSSTPLREALAQLAAEGIVSFRANSGYRVRDAPTDIERALWAEARIAIESQSIRLARNDLLGPGVVALRDSNAQIAGGTDSPAKDEIVRFTEANWAFHRSLVLLSGNPFLESAHATLNQGSRFSQVFLGHGVRDRSRIVEEHEAIISLLEAKDLGAAADALAAHINNSTHRDRGLSAANLSSHQDDTETS